MLESKTQKEISDYLNLFGICVIIGVGKFKVDNRFISMTGGFNKGRGFPDLVFIYDSRIHLIEVKTAKGKLSDNQQVFHQECKKQGVAVLIMRSLDDAEKFIDKFQKGTYA